MSYFHTLRKVSQIADKTLEGVLFSAGLTRAQYTTLDALTKLPKPACQFDIVTLTAIDRSTMSDVLRRLEKRGLITRKRRKEDARAIDISLTQAGEDLVSKAVDLIPQAEALLSRQVVGIDRLGIVQQAAE